jgi:hypothetical protein
LEYRIPAVFPTRLKAELQGRQFPRAIGAGPW